MSLNVYLAGEGENEIGSLVHDPAYAHADGYEGVLQAVLSILWQEQPYEVVGGRAWRSLRKFVVGRGRKIGLKGAEQQNVAKLRLLAAEGGQGVPPADVLVFVRDSDGDQDRVKAIREALEEPGLPTAGGIPIQRLESWLLAIAGTRKSESLSNSDADQRLSALGVPRKDTAAMVELVHERGLQNVPHDATSLRDWMRDVERVGATTSGG